MRIVDRDGLDRLTMRALGRELGVDPMAVYYYFPNKTAILDGVVEAFWSELDPPLLEGQPWQTQLEQIARAMRDMLRRHPNAIPVLSTRPNLSFAGLKVVDRIIGVLLAAGIEPREALEFVNAAGEFILGHALAEASPPLIGVVSSEDDFFESEALADPATFAELPALRAVTASIDLRTVTMDDIFEAGLSALRRGLEQRLADRAEDRESRRR